MAISKLIFFPTDVEQLFNKEELIKKLIDIEFIEAQAHQDNHYLCGEKFLNLLTFLGCSPNINLQPNEKEAHCFISTLGPFTDITCLGFTNTIKPKCPHCKKRIADWKTHDWQTTSTECNCDKCGISTAYSKLNWKQECGFALCGFEVTHIYPHEAVPGDKLLNELQSISGFAWDYCYSNN